MVILPHSSYSPDLGSCDFTLFSKLEMKLKGRHFETEKHGKNDEFSAYVPREAILKMAANTE
jgi:hypothetical protein